VPECQLMDQAAEKGAEDLAIWCGVVPHEATGPQSWSIKFHEYYTTRYLDIQVLW
jgi:hypothetical protein